MRRLILAFLLIAAGQASAQQGTVFAPQATDDGLRCYFNPNQPDCLARAEQRRVEQQRFDEIQRGAREIERAPPRPAPSVPLLNEPRALDCSGVVLPGGSFTATCR